MVPLWFRLGVLAFLLILLGVVIVADISSDGYEAQSTALALVGAISAGIAADQLKRGGKNE